MCIYKASLETSRSLSENCCDLCNDIIVKYTIIILTNYFTKISRSQESGATDACADNVYQAVRAAWDRRYRVGASIPGRVFAFITAG